MNNINVVGLDLAKSVFQVHAVDKTGRVVKVKQLKRAQVLSFFSRIPSCTVGMEACGGAHYWARELTHRGHHVRLMAAAFVKPYVKSNKNDRHDAEAICEAVQRPTMRFVRVKTPDQQAVLHLIRARRLLLQQYIALGNHLRGVLQEYGIVLPLGRKVLSERLPLILEDADNGLPILARDALFALFQEQRQLDQRIRQLEQKLQAWNQRNEPSQRLQTIPGVGPLTASALVASVGNAEDFKNARQMAAYLGLVPRQSSSGGRNVLLGISKRGDGYLRSLLVHGARAVIRQIKCRIARGEPSGNPWVEQLLQRCHPNEVAVALANKMARIAWAVLRREECYRAPVVV